MCVNHSSTPSIMSSLSGPVLIHIGWSRSSQFVLLPMSDCLVWLRRGHVNVMWVPVCGWPHWQNGESASSILCSQLFCGPFSVLIHAYAASALWLNEVSERLNEGSVRHSFLVALLVYLIPLCVVVDVRRRMSPSHECSLAAVSACSFPGCRYEP